MKKRIPSILPMLICTILSYPAKSAFVNGQCMQGITPASKPLTNQSNDDEQPVQIESDNTTVEYPKQVIFDGHVHIKQGNRYLSADKAEVEQIQGENKHSQAEKVVTATGNVHYKDPQIQLSGPKATSNLNTKDTDIYDGHYQMVGRQGRGSAAELKVRDQQRYTILKNGSFTSCLPGDNSWSVVGSTIIHDRKEQVAKIWNARFKIGPVPIFYSPYLQLPVGSQRRSGFLIPNAKYTNYSGFEFLLPFYWNIAPNYDATITPHYISRRGLQWQTEFRYLNLFGAGTAAFDYLPNDTSYTRDSSSHHHDRWLLYWQNNSVINKVWHVNVHYTKVSDYRYFNDLDSSYGSSTDGYATQIFSLGYADKNWNATLSTKKFQVFTQDGDPNAYRAQPQLDFNYYKNTLGPFNFHLYTQLAKFISNNPNNPSATRFHAAPEIILPLANRWGSLNTEVKLLATEYHQNIPQGYNDTLPLKSSVSRILPEFKVNGQMVFERQMQLLPDYTQTLEPQIQYLYIPFKDQSNIYTYDTTLLQTDYTGLFRDQEFSGLDRIASANQIAAGVTSRVYDEKLNERLSASIGQIYYINPSRTTTLTYNDTHNITAETAKLAWAADAVWHITPLFNFKTSAQYNTRINSLMLFSSTLEYRQDNAHLLQLNYRYASSNYITAMLPNYTNSANYALYKDGISQAGVVASVPVSNNFSMVGSYYFDTNRKETADSLVGLQYNTCCWAVQIGYERKVSNWNATNHMSQYDNRYSFNIELRGLGDSSSPDTVQMLQSTILPYQSSF